MDWQKSDHQERLSRERRIRGGHAIMSRRLNPQSLAGSDSSGLTMKSFNPDPWTTLLAGSATK